MCPASMRRGVPFGLSAATELPCTSDVTWSVKPLTWSRHTRAGAVSKPEGPGVSSRRFKKSNVSSVMVWTPSREGCRVGGVQTMTEDTLDFLKRLLDTPGPSGFETAPARVWRDHV